MADNHDGFDLSNPQYRPGPPVKAYTGNMLPATPGAPELRSVDARCRRCERSWRAERASAPAAGKFVLRPFSGLTLGCIDPNCQQNVAQIAEFNS